MIASDHAFNQNTGALLGQIFFKFRLLNPSVTLSTEGRKEVAVTLLLINFSSRVISNKYFIISQAMWKSENFKAR